MLPTAVNIADAAEAVRSFNHLYGEMDRALWRLSSAGRASLLSGDRPDTLAELVWTVKSWWGIQGVRSEVKTIGARALTVIPWSKEFLQEVQATVSVSPEEFAVERVTSFVRAMVELGARRREFSLASKVLHWLFPWHISVYDSFVRSTLLIPTSWSHEDAYRKISDWEFRVAQQLTSQGSDWIGEVEPKSPLRAIDKYLWWKGGGASGRAVIVRDPWKVVHRLGLRPI